ncbi:M20/M25/M40 family metallo-hydrolase [Kytococcus sedentarius]|uniref:M20/M25/M40 family metallo-hydrolase n=1 Tax=Kytococcus sedentarius TaxID=1276 RepID=UPI0035BC7621
MRRSTLSAFIATPALALSMAGIALSPTVGASNPDLGPEATAAVDFQAPNGGVDDSPVFVVAAADDQPQLGEVAARVDTLRDASGQEVVISRTTADKVAELHEAPAGERGAGFRTFPTWAAAEEFIASDRSAEATTQALALPGIDNQATVEPWLDQVQESRIRQTISDLSTNWPNRYYASSHGKAAAAHVHDQWSGIAAGRSDVTVAYDESCGSSCGVQPNVTMTVQGTENPDEVVVVGAHFDSISNSGSGDSMDAPGADDNASATATVTEVAQVALANGWKPQRTVVFAAYAAEEVGLRGSAAMANSYASQGKDVVGVLNLDMTNYDGGAYDMSLMQDNTNADLNTFSREVFDAYLAPQGMTMNTMTCGYGCSDHASWTSAGYPASMVSESELFPHLHTPNDTLDATGGTADHSVKFAKFGLAFVGELAKTGA